MIASLLKNNPFYQNDAIRMTLYVLGTFIILKKVISTIRSMLKYFLPRKDLAQRYGPKSWALISGGSKGVGKAFADELASEGFNLILVGRSLSKLEEAKQDIKSKFSTVEVRLISADFTKSYQEGYVNKICEQVSDLDISILVNNVGESIIKHYVDITHEQITGRIGLNCLSHVLLTKFLLPKLQARKNKSAIINTSSYLAVDPYPVIQLYGATKVFTDFFSRGLAYEHPNIDILAFRPVSVATPGLAKYRALSIGALPPSVCVRGALRALGRSDVTFGSWIHALEYAMASYVPSFILRSFMGVVLSHFTKYD